MKLPDPNRTARIIALCAFLAGLVLLIVFSFQVRPEGILARGFLGLIMLFQIKEVAHWLTFLEEDNGRSSS